MSIRKHLPLKSKDAFTNLQVKMETLIVEEVKLFMKFDEISWNDLLTACFRSYLEESRLVHSDKDYAVQETNINNRPKNFSKPKERHP